MMAWTPGLAGMAHARYAYFLASKQRASYSLSLHAATFKVKKIGIQVHLT